MNALVDTFLSDIPTRKSEAWKYTDLKAIASVAEATGWTQAPERSVDVAPLFGGLDVDTVHVVDGVPDASDLIGEDNGKFKVSPREGRTLHLAFVSTADQNEAFAAGPSFSLTVGGGQHLSIIESHTSLGNGNNLSMPRMAIALGRDANLHHAVLVDEGAASFHLSKTSVSMAQGASYEGFALETGQGLCRREVSVVMEGEHATAKLGGAYLGRESALIDNTTFVDHQSPNAASRQEFRGVLDDDSRGVFQGKVHVAKDAQGTDGQQQHKALLLSPKAEVDAKPELEIYADDVQCAHGATVGAIDDQQLFYLRARGIPEAAARAILTEAFLMQSLSNIANTDIREEFRAHLASRLGETG